MPRLTRIGASARPCNELSAVPAEIIAPSASRADPGMPSPLPPGAERCGGLVQRPGTSRLMDRSGIEQLDRNGEPRRLRQACVGGQEWTANNFRQGDIRRVVRGEVGTP